MPYPNCSSSSVPSQSICGGIFAELFPVRVIGRVFRIDKLLYRVSAHHQHRHGSALPEHPALLKLEVQHGRLDPRYAYIRLISARADHSGNLHHGDAASTCSIAAMDCTVLSVIPPRPDTADEE